MAHGPALSFSNETVNTKAYLEWTSNTAFGRFDFVRQPDGTVAFMASPNHIPFSDGSAPTPSQQDSVPGSLYSTLAKFTWAVETPSDY